MGTSGAVAVLTSPCEVNGINIYINIYVIRTHHAHNKYDNEIIRLQKNTNSPHYNYWYEVNGMLLFEILQRHAHFQNKHSQHPYHILTA